MFDSTEVSSLVYFRNDYSFGSRSLEQQLLSKGYGPDKPIASNATKAGRAKNRRIEIIRLK